MTISYREFMRHYEADWITDCRAGSDGDCTWSECPQLRDGEPVATGRHCPLDRPHNAAVQP